MKIKWMNTALVGLFVASALLSACSPQAGTPVVTAAQPAPQGTPVAEVQPTAQPTQAAEKSVTIAFAGDPATLNPLYATVWTEQCALDLMFLPLWTLDDQGKYYPELAEEVPTQENGGVIIGSNTMTVTIKLRKDANWSDGGPVTADDAVFTYNMIMDPKNTVGSRYPYDTYVSGMKAVDEKTLQIYLNSIYVDWVTSIFSRLSRVIPRHVLEPVFIKDGTLDAAAFNRLPSVVNGQYTISEFEAGSHLTFVANDHYWRGRPRLDKIIWRILPDRAAVLAALGSDQTDIGTYILGSEIPQIKKMGSMEIFTSPNGYILNLFLNVSPKTASPGMEDVNVRKAIILSIDRQLIINQIFYGAYEVPSTYWHATVYDNPNLKPYPYDPAQAKTLLDQAGWKLNSQGIREKDGKELILRYVYISGDQNNDTMAVSIQQMLADVGIKVDLLPNSQSVLWASFADGGPMANGKFDLSHFSDGMWYFPSPDTSYFICSQIPTADSPDGYNWYGICDPELDRLFALQATEVDQQKRIQIFHQIGQIMYDKVYIIPLRNDPDIWAVNQRVTNLKFAGPNPLAFAYLWDVK